MKLSDDIRQLGGVGDMVFFQMVTLALPLSFNPVELGFFERKLVQGLYVGFGSHRRLSTSLSRRPVFS